MAVPAALDVAYEYTFTPITGFFLLDAALQGEWDVFCDAFRHIILPASLLGYFSLAYISRMTRSFMLNELAQEYIVAARAKGLSETRVIWRHALRNAAVPLVTVIALSYAGLLEGSVLTETVFAWPGIGLYITNSLQNADMNAVLGGTLVIGAVFIGINLLSDLLYRVLDPRTQGMMSAAIIQSRRDWLLTDRPHSRLQARLGRAYVGWRRFSANRLALRRPAHHHRCCWSSPPSPACWRPTRRHSATSTMRGCCRRAPRTGSAPTISAATSFRASSTARAHAVHRHPGRDHRRPRSACWSAPSPAMSAAGSIPC